MKLQLQGQRMRLRLDEAELARLLADEPIVNATGLGTGLGFCQSLRLHADAQPTLQATPGEWQVGLPGAAVRDYVQRLPCRDALEFTLACDDGAVLALAFEVDVRDSLKMRGARRRSGGGTSAPV
jgi:hypothetical protein